MITSSFYGREGEHLPELTMADGVVRLGLETLGDRTIRALQVQKLRGRAPLLGRHSLGIGGDGAAVFARVESMMEASDARLSEHRKSLGLDALETTGAPLDAVVPEALRQPLLRLLDGVHAGESSATVNVDLTEDELGIRSEGDRVVFFVTATGLGIEEHEIEEIFKPFVQLNRGYTRTVDGTGLGLSISRHLAGLLGGEITAESTPGEGSTFTVSVPARLPERD
jgi:K+-sensing histidine kinase KdpD